MNEQLHIGSPADGQSPTTRPADLMQAVSTSMAEIAGSIGGTIAGALAAPLTAASHAVSITRAGPAADGAPADLPDDEMLAATSRLEAGEPRDADGQAGPPAGEAG